jgi:hypothetical protein
MKQIVACLVVIFVTGACFSTTQVAPMELYRLNGYQGREMSLTSIDGDQVSFDKKSELKIQATDGQQMNAKYTSISVDNSGLMTGVMRGSGAPVNIDINQVAAVSVVNYSHGRTAGLVVPLVLVPIIAIIALAVVYGSSGGGEFSAR